MQRKPLPIQPLRLSGNERIDVGDDRVQHPIAARRPIHPQEKQARDGRKWNRPQHGAFGLTDEKEAKDGSHRRICQLLGVARQQQQRHHPRQQAVALFAVRFLLFNQHRHQHHSDGFKHHHEQMLPK